MCQSHNIIILQFENTPTYKVVYPSNIDQAAGIFEDKALDALRVDTRLHATVEVVAGIVFFQEVCKLKHLQEHLFDLEVSA